MIPRHSHSPTAAGARVASRCVARPPGPAPPHALVRAAAGPLAPVRFIRRPGPAAAPRRVELLCNVGRQVLGALRVHQDDDSPIPVSWPLIRHADSIAAMLSG